MLIYKLRIFITTSIIIFICLFSFQLIKSSANSSSRYTLSTAQDVYTELLSCYKYEENQNYKGPMKVTNGTLTYNNHSKEVYWIYLCGYDNIANQPTNTKNYIQSLFNLTNDYQKLIKEKIITHIPANSNIIFCGHSLGGMVSQQLAKDTYIKNNYHILYTITYGSPL